MIKSLGPSFFIAIILTWIACGSASSLAAEASNNTKKVNSDLSTNAVSVSHPKPLSKIEHPVETNTDIDDSATTIDNTQTPEISPLVVVTESGDIDFAATRLSRRLDAVRTTGPIKIDGRLDEATWKDAPIATDFIQIEPNAGAPATDRTEVRVLYDDDNLYFGVFNQDDQPELAIVNDIRRDFRPTEGDIFGVVVDTFHDERNGYQFETNPAGAKWDSQVGNEGRGNDSNWDGVWHVDTHIVEDGWYAEMAVPFRTMNFSDSSPQTWGLNFLRRVRRKNEDSAWAPYPRIFRIFRVSLAGTLEGLEGLRAGNKLRFKPYVLMNSHQLAGTARTNEANFGIDIKYGLTNSLTWDFTVNTDFSQVEADEQQINLTRFSLFFPEKRDFFLENSGVFQFGPGGRRRGGGGRGGGRQNAQRNDLILFFSRRIGLSDDGNVVPILAGTRLTGRVGNGTAVGAMNIQQQSQGDVSATNFSALRLRQDFFENSDVGIMALNKNESNGHYNRTFGADLNFRFFSNLTISGLVAKTFDPYTASNNQTDNLATSANIGWADTFWDLRASHIQIGEEFNDEMGFVPRTGIDKTELAAGIRLRPKATSRWLREIYPHWQLVNVTRHSDDQLDSRYYDYHLPFNFQDGTFVEMGVNPNIENISEPFEINSRREIFIQPGRYLFDENFLLVRTNRSARLSFSGRYATGDFYDGHKQTVEFGIATRVNKNFNFSTEISRNKVELSGGAFTTDLLRTKINYNFSTQLFLNSFFQYNTDAKQLNSNVRLNLIHRPLSNFFIVYNERRDSQTNQLIDRAVIGKLTYMMEF